MIRVGALLALAMIATPSLAAPPKGTPLSEQQSAADQRGTEKMPVVARVLPTPKTEEESAREHADRSDASSANWWLVRLTGIIGLIGFLQLFVFGRQASRLKEIIDKMDEIAAGQTGDMKSSIAEATRAATAMEGVATSMAANVDSVRVSVASV